MAWTKTDNIQAQGSSPIYDGRFPSITRPALTGGAVGFTKSIERHGVTWEFDEYVQYGHYVSCSGVDTGDPWWCDAGHGGQVISQTPALDSGRNGSMVNPTVGGTQAYDIDAELYSTTGQVTYPLAMSAGDSLVTSITNPNADGSYDSEWWGSIGSLIKVAGYSILTKESTPPAANKFRPPYVAGAKPTYTTDNINTSVLPNITAPASTPSNAEITDQQNRGYERGFARPWVSHISGYQARSMNAADNMPTYHTWMGEWLCTAMNIFAVGAHTTEMLNGLCQTAIDQYHVSIGGSGPRATFEIITIIGGALLQDNAMRDLFVNQNSLTSGRAETKMYLWNRKQSTQTSATVTAGQTWTGATVFWRTTAGEEEHEHLHPSEWNLTSNSPDTKAEENYRLSTDEHGHVGYVLAARLFGFYGANTKFIDDAPDQYLTRWITEDYDATYKPTVVATYPAFVGSATQQLGTTFLNDLYAQEYP